VIVSKMQAGNSDSAGGDGPKGQLSLPERERPHRETGFYQRRFADAHWRFDPLLAKLAAGS